MKLLIVIVLLAIILFCYSLVKVAGNADRDIEKLFDAFVLREECSNEEVPNRC